MRLRRLRFNKRTSMRLSTTSKELLITSWSRKSWLTTRFSLRASSFSWKERTRQASSFSLVSLRNYLLSRSKWLITSLRLFISTELTVILCRMTSTRLLKTIWGLTNWRSLTLRACSTWLCARVWKLLRRRSTKTPFLSFQRQARRCLAIETPISWEQFLSFNMLFISL